MGHIDAPLLHEGDLLVAGQDTVGHNAVVVAAEEAESVVSVAVEPGPGAQLLDQSHLAPVLRQVGLDGHVKFLPQLAQPVHQVVGAGGGEAGGDDGGHPLIPPGAGLQPPAGHFLGGLRALLTQGVGGVAVHVHLAYHGHQAGLLQQVHQQKGGGSVEGGKDAGAGVGAVLHVLHKAGIGLAGVVQVGVPGLLGEGVPVQPVQQLQVHAQATEGVLRGVDVEVHQTGNHQMAAPVLHRQVGVLLRQGLKHAGRPAVQTDQPPVLDGVEMAGISAPAEVALECKAALFHHNLLSAHCAKEMSHRRGPGAGKKRAAGSTPIPG